MSYGFYTKNNPYSNTVIKVALTKPQINTQKHSLITKMGLVDSFEGFFNSQHSTIVLMMLSEKVHINNKLLDILRIYNTKNDLFKPDYIQKRLSKGQWLSYENEMVSLASYKYFIYNYHLKSAKLGLPDVIQSLTLTKNFLKENKANLEKDPKLMKKYQVRTKIMEVIRESVAIQHKHIIFSNEKTQDILADQISKLRLVYLK